MGAVVDMSIDSARQPYFDKATWPVKRVTAESGVRIVPGGSSIRDGCYIGKGVTCMPPMYINTGSWVGDGTMIDSHALVGSCAQIGKQLPHFGGGADRGRAGTGGCDAGDHRRRCSGGRQLRCV